MGILLYSQSRNYITVCKKNPKQTNKNKQKQTTGVSSTWSHLTVCKQIINTKLNYSCSIEILETI